MLRCKLNGSWHITDQKGSLLQFVCIWKFLKNDQPCRSYISSSLTFIVFIDWIGPKNQKENAIGQVSLFILESTHKNHLKGHELTYIVFIDWIGPKNQKEKAISQVSFFHPHTRIIWKAMNPWTIWWCKCLVACWAVEWFLNSTFYLILLQNIWHCEWLVTFWAAEWSLSTMSSLMT